MVNKSQLGNILWILDLARWAPSGDNTQPWRFEVCSDRQLVVHGFDTRHKCVYDLQGHASHLAIGALLEYISIAATEMRLNAKISYRIPPLEPDENPAFDIVFTENPNIKNDSLFPFLKIRCVNRHPLDTDQLTKAEKYDLEQSIQEKFPFYKIFWVEGILKKFAMANIIQKSGKLRFTIPEAYVVHKEVIEWGAKFSENRIPDQAIGLSRPILPLMKWIMGSWSRVSFFNKYMGGTLIPRLELDFLPSLFCSAHFVLIAPNPPKSLGDYAEAGRALVRFWLGNTKLGLQFQPEMTPLIFRSYVNQNLIFSTRRGSKKEALHISSHLEQLMGKENLERAVFMGRIGRGKFPESRSHRLSLPSLILDHKD